MSFDENGKEMKRIPAFSSQAIHIFSLIKKAKCKTEAATRRQHEQVAKHKQDEKQTVINGMQAR